LRHRVVCECFLVSLPGVTSITACVSTCPCVCCIYLCRCVVCTYPGVCRIYLSRCVCVCVYLSRCAVSTWSDEYHGMCVELSRCAVSTCPGVSCLPVQVCAMCLPGVTSITATTTSPQMTSITSNAMTMPRQFLLSVSPPTNSCHTNER